MYIVRRRPHLARRECEKTGGPLLRAVDRFSRPLSASPPTCKNYPTEGRGHMSGPSVRSHAPHKNKQAVHTEVALIADNNAIGRIKHHQALRHIVKGGVYCCISAAQCRL